jgi:hypothetical protein
MSKECDNYYFVGNTMPIDLEDLRDVDKYLAGGFQKIAICKHGIGRSFKYADEECKKGRGTLFLEGGLDTLQQMANSANKWEIIDALRAFPERIFLLNKEEVNKYLEYIRQVRGSIILGDWETGSR